MGLQRIQNAKMSRNGFADTERAERVLWIAEGYKKQQHIERSWINTKRVLQHGVWYENGTKSSNQVGVIHTGPE